MEKTCLNISHDEHKCLYSVIDTCLNCQESFCSLHGCLTDRMITQHTTALRFCSATCMNFFYQNDLMNPESTRVCRRCRYFQTCTVRELCFACIPAVFVLKKTIVFLKQLRIQYIAMMKRDFPKILPLTDLNIIIYSYTYGDFCALLYAPPLPRYRHLLQTDSQRENLNR